jgi:hypothetical protein
VSTMTALKSSAGLCAMEIVANSSNVPRGWQRGNSSAIGLLRRVPVISRIILSIIYLGGQVVSTYIAISKAKHQVNNNETSMKFKCF